MKKTFFLMILFYTTLLLAQDGTIDSTFGNEGFAYASLGLTATVTASEVQVDGDVIVAGYYTNINNTKDNASDWFLAKYNPSGSLDPNFGNKGVVSTHLSNYPSGDFLTSIKIQSDGKILAGGYSWNDSLEYDFTLIRYNPTGNLDYSFGENGVVRTNISNWGNKNDWGLSMALQTDDKILVVGYTFFKDSSIYVKEVGCVLRYNSNGILDDGFGDKGIFIMDIPDSIAQHNGFATDSYVSLQSVKSQSDGKIIIAGYYIYSRSPFSFEYREAFLLARLNENGTLDKSFGEKGIALTFFDGYRMGDENGSLIIQNDDKIIFSGSAYDSDVFGNNHFFIAKYNKDGIIDKTFGYAGISQSQFWGTCYKIVQQPDKKIIAVGRIDSDPYGHGSCVVRYNIDGSLDNTFSLNGINFINVNDQSNSGLFEWNTASLLPNGKLITAGNRVNTGTIALSLYKAFNNSIISIYPPKCGNTGLVTVNVYGSGFSDGSSVKLKGIGNEIIGENTIVDKSGSQIITTFNMQNEPIGIRDLVIENSDTNVVLKKSFTVEETKEGDIWVDIIGRDRFLVGHPQTWTILYGNKGNIDLYGNIIWISGIPVEAEWSPRFKIENYDSTTLGFEVPGKTLLIPIFIPIIPANSSYQLPIRINMKENNNFNLLASSTGPLIGKELLLKKVSSYSEFNSLSHYCDAKEFAECVDGPIEIDDLFWDLVDIVLPAECPETVYKYLFDQIRSTVSLTLTQSETEKYKKAFDLVKVLFTGKTNIVLDCIPSSHILVKVIKFFLYSLFEAAANGTNGGLPGAPKADCGCIPPSPPPNPKSITAVASLDPNDKIGSASAGTKHYISGEEPLRYSILFENKNTATAPAQEVFISDSLDKNNLDLSSFSFSNMSFGTNGLIDPPSGLNNYTTNIDLRPGKNIVLQVKSNLDSSSGMIKWSFRSLDPVTMKLTEDPLGGFLPPNINPPEGEGSVTYTVKPRSNLSTGFQIQNKASIVFDLNDPIETPVWINTIDNDLPTSYVLSLAETQTDTSFDVKWIGSDAGSGLANYSIYISRDNNPFELWLNTSDTTATFIRDSSKSYGFYSIAQDASGNREALKNSAEASTKYLTGTEEKGSNIPKVFSLSQNYPNPFNPETKIDFDIPKKSHVKLTVYDILGRQVVILLDEEKTAGKYSLVWNPKGLASGVYLYQIQADGFDNVKKLIIIK